MHNSSEVSHPVPEHALANAFYAAVAELSHVVEAGTIYRAEAEAFVSAANKVRVELARLAEVEGEERAAAENRIVQLLDGVTTVALETSPRYRELHRAAFEVAVRASQLAFVLRDLTTPITWH